MSSALAFSCVITSTFGHGGHNRIRTVGSPLVNHKVHCEQETNKRAVGSRQNNPSLTHEQYRHHKEAVGKACCRHGRRLTRNQLRSGDSPLQNSQDLSQQQLSSPAERPCTAFARKWPVTLVAAGSRFSDTANSLSSRLRACDLFYSKKQSQWRVPLSGRSEERQVKLLRQVKSNFCVLAAAL